MEPTARSWILGSQLRRLREAKGLKAKEVAERWLDCSTSRVYSIEGGYRTLNVLELRGLVNDAYERTDLLPQMEELLSTIERGSKSPIKDALTAHPNRMLVHQLEPYATAAYGVALDQVPKLAQTREYMAAQCSNAGYSNDESKGLIRAGMERQEVFFNLVKPPLTRIIITEGALARASLIDYQMDRLVERALHPAIEISMIPSDVGPHSAFSSFTLMEFGTLPTLLYLDLVTGGSLVDDDEDIKTARKCWDQLSSLALTPVETLDFMAQRGMAKA